MKERERKKKVTNRVGGKPEETLKYKEQTALLEGRWVGGIEEDTCWDEHWVLYVSDESLDSTPEAKTILYVN